jgi:glucose/arabinose dehydrogenase
MELMLEAPRRSQREPMRHTGSTTTARVSAHLAVIALAVTTIGVAGPAHGLARGVIAARPVVTGLNDPAAFTFLPGDRIVYLERGTGEIHVFDPGSRTDHRFFTISGVNGDGERGALGVAVHPGWPTRHSLYVYVTRRTGGHLRNQIVRVTRSKRNTTMTVLVSTPASSSPYHNGGRILFGPDGMLYAIVGDGHDSSNAQDRTGDLRGKILRMRPDGSAPADNPIAGSRVFAFGIRNSFGFAFDQTTERLWETENGPECNDEINLIVPGNFGWGPNEQCGSQPAPGDTNNSGPSPRHPPKAWFGSPIGITGGAFCDGCGLGAGVEGDLFFGCVNDGALRRVALNADRDDVSGDPVRILDAPHGAIYSMESGPNGRVYFSDSHGIYRLVRT